VGVSIFLAEDYELINAELGYNVCEQWAMTPALWVTVKSRGRKRMRGSCSHYALVTLHAFAMGKRINDLIPNMGWAPII